MAESPKTGSDEFGEYLRGAREQRGLSRRDLAAATGLSYPYISQIETGYRLPSTPALRSLADALGLSADELFDAIPGDRDPARDAAGPRADAVAPRSGRARAFARREPTLASRPPAPAPSAGAAPTRPPMPPAPAAPFPAAGGSAGGGAATRDGGAGSGAGEWLANPRFAAAGVAPPPAAAAATAGGPPSTGAGVDAGAEIVDAATGLLISLPSDHRLAALAEVQRRVVRSVVDDGVQAAFDLPR